MMKNYKIETKETLSRVIEIKAQSAEEAIDKARASHQASLSHIICDVQKI